MMVKRVTLYAAILIAWSFFLYQAFVITVLSREIPVHVFSEEILTPDVNPGGPIIVRVSLFRENACRQDIIQWIEDSRGVQFELPVVHIPDDAQLGSVIIKRSIDLPTSMSTGKATLYLSPRFVCYWSNYLWPLSNVTHKLNFVVKSKQAKEN